MRLIWKKLFAAGDSFSVELVYPSFVNIIPTRILDYELYLVQYDYSAIRQDFSGVSQNLSTGNYSGQTTFSGSVSPVVNLAGISFDWQMLLDGEQWLTFDAPFPRPIAFEVPEGYNFLKVNFAASSIPDLKFWVHLLTVARARVEVPVA